MSVQAATTRAIMSHPGRVEKARKLTETRTTAKAARERTANLPAVEPITPPSGSTEPTGALELEDEGAVAGGVESIAGKLKT